MSNQSEIFAALKGLVGNRCFPVDFPQAESVMTWPAIRYTFVSDVPGATVCGDTGDESDIRIQLDVVATTADAMRALVAQVKAAMKASMPNAARENVSEVFDSETRTYRAILDYMIYQ
jgi:hypothetical protein